MFVFGQRRGDGPCPIGSSQYTGIIGLRTFDTWLTQLHWIADDAISSNFCRDIAEMKLR